MIIIAALAGSAALIGAGYAFYGIHGAIVGLLCSMALALVIDES